MEENTPVNDISLYLKLMLIPKKKEEFSDIEIPTMQKYLANVDDFFQSYIGLSFPVGSILRTINLPQTVWEL